MQDLLYESLSLNSRLFLVHLLAAGARTAAGISLIPFDLPSLLLFVFHLEQILLSLFLNSKMWFHSYLLLSSLAALGWSGTVPKIAPKTYDAIIIGGGPSDRSALSGLARVRRRASHRLWRIPKRPNQGMCTMSLALMVVYPRCPRTCNHG